MVTRTHPSLMILDLSMLGSSNSTITTLPSMDSGSWVVLTHKARHQTVDGTRAVEREDSHGHFR